MKKLKFKLKASVGPFIPYKNFYWNRRYPQLVSMSFNDYFSDANSPVSLSADVTQSVAVFASQIAYNTIKTGVDTPYPVRASAAANYTNAFESGSTIPSTNVFSTQDYIEHSAIYDEDKLPDALHMGTYAPEIIHSSDVTASFAKFKARGYSKRTKRAWNNAESEIQRFYKGEDLSDYAIIKSVKKPDCPNCKFRIKRSLRDSSNSLKDITLCVAITNDYMPTTNLDMMGPYPWVWSLPYGGLGEHTTDVFADPSSYNLDSFNASGGTRMLRSKLNVQDQRIFKFTFNIVSDALEELSFEEFFTTASVTTTAQSFVDGGYANTSHTMPFEKYFDYGVDKDGFAYLGLKSENITALLNPDHSTATAITAMSGTITSDVPNTAPISPYITDYDDNKGVWLRVYDCGDGNISAAELFGLDGRKKVGQMKENVFLEEAILAIPLVENYEQLAEPLKIDRETVLNRMKYLQKDGQLRFKHFKEEDLGGITLNRDTKEADPPNPVDDFILASEKYVFPPEFDVSRILEDKTWTPFFGVVFEFSKKLSRCDRLSLWQGVLTDNLLASEEVEQSIVVPVELFGPNFKFENKSIRVMLLKVKKRAETNYKVWRSKLLNVKYDQEEDYRQSYNYPYDEFTILPVGELVAEVYCKEDEEA